jgi:hypothetical protein
MNIQLIQFGLGLIAGLIIGIFINSDCWLCAALPVFFLSLSSRYLQLKYNES